MGNWNINIQGIGCHHNQNNPTDANLMTAEFVRLLRSAGHVIEHATFTHGGKDQGVADAVCSTQCQSVPIHTQSSPVSSGP